ncbi:MAG: hypothetical protein PVG27_00125 [Chloroflexota bacterium]|jgi:hypothetical protein
MKKAIGIIAASAFAIAAISAPVAAKPGVDAGEPYCFGQVHKAVNAGLLSAAGIDNVGQLVQSDLAAGFGMKGQGKNAIANSVCTPES